jgi:hypothetical protein
MSPTRKLASRSSFVAGAERELFAVLHAGFRSIQVVVCIEGTQREWTLASEDTAVAHCRHVR